MARDVLHERDGALADARDRHRTLFHRLERADMITGITVGPDPVASHEVIHYIYDTTDGRIVASYHLLGAPSSVPERSAALLREAAQHAGLAPEYLNVLEVSPRAAVPGPGGPRRLRVDPAGRRLVSQQLIPIRHARA
jgi:hypothetical protein